jgi:hypothetical protein
MKPLFTTLLILALLVSSLAQQSYEGSGLRLVVKEGAQHPQIEALVLNSPAARTNLRPGETIYAIDGKSAAGLSAKEAEALINGPAGKKTVLTVGETRREVTIVNAEIRGYCLEGDCENGAGVYAEIDGSRYEGQFVKGRFEGEGKVFFGEELDYAGQFRNGLRHGRGKVQANGHVYEGEWVDGRPEGEFTIAFANGNRYQGQFSKGKPNGYGVMTYPNGQRYEGQWRDGARTEGKYFWSDTEYYEGPFDASGRTGFGKYYYPNGIRYEGMWQSGEMSGPGKLVFPDGAVFEGEFSGDRASGVLRFFEKNAEVPMENAGIGEILGRWGESG